MKTRNIVIILMAVAVGSAITLVSGFFEQTQLPADLWAGTAQTWGGLPFGWWGYSQIGHVYFAKTPNWFSLTLFMLDVAFWFLISSALSFAILRFARVRKKIVP
jgi:hypothetical protein